MLHFHKNILQIWQLLFFGKKNDYIFFLFCDGHYFITKHNYSCFSAKILEAWVLELFPNHRK